MARLDFFDFRGGVNTRFSPDVLDRTEVREAKNARLSTYGSLEKRAGTKRMHSTALSSGADVLGLFQWDNPSQSGELIAVAGGDLEHKALADANYTNVSSTLSTTNRPVFAKFTVSGTDTLFVADGALRKWTGTTLTTSIAGAPSAKYIAVYKSRLFAADGTKTLYWSKIADPETWASPDGGQAFVETYDDDVIVGLATVGSSLLIFKENNIARFTGASAATIQIDQDTEGVSPDVGCIAPRSIVRVENFVFFLSDRGPYIATEASVQAVGEKIEDQFQDAPAQYLVNAVSVHNPFRKEVWLFIPEAGETENTVGWCWNYRLGSWTGPFEMGFNVLSAARFERADGTEAIMLGGSDGFVRDGDVSSVGAKDDVLSDGTGGTNITMDVTLPDLLMGDPTAVKLLHNAQHVQADLKTYGELKFRTSGELTSGTQELVKASKGAGTRDYIFRPAWRGRRPTLTLRDATDEIIEITGVTVNAKMGRRVV